MNKIDSPLTSRFLYETNMFVNTPNVVGLKEAAGYFRSGYRNWFNPDDVSDGLDWARGLEVAEYCDDLD